MQRIPWTQCVSKDEVLEKIEIKWPLILTRKNDVTRTLNEENGMVKFVTHRTD